jgi:hypothetical protein
LQRVLSEAGGDLLRFYDEARRLARMDKDARALAVCSS